MAIESIVKCAECQKTAPYLDGQIIPGWLSVAVTDKTAPWRSLEVKEGIQNAPGFEHNCSIECALLPIKRLFEVKFDGQLPVAEEVQPASDGAFPANVTEDIANRVLALLAGRSFGVQTPPPVTMVPQMTRPLGSSITVVTAESTSPAPRNTDKPKEANWGYGEIAAIK